MSDPEEKLFVKEEPKEPTILDWIIIQDDLSPQVILGLTTIFISVAFMFYHLYTGFFGQPEAHLFRSVHLTFVFMLTFLFYPLRRKSWKDELNGWFLIDFLGILLSVATQVYYLVDPDDFMVRIADPSTLDMIMGTIVILLVMETARRVIGNAMVILSAFFLIHALYADKFFGFLYSPPSTIVPSSPMWSWRRRGFIRHRSQRSPPSWSSSSSSEPFSSVPVLASSFSIWLSFWWPGIRVELEKCRLSLPRLSGPFPEAPSPM